MLDHRQHRHLENGYSLMYQREIDIVENYLLSLYISQHSDEWDLSPSHKIECSHLYKTIVMIITTVIMIIVNRFSV